MTTSMIESCLCQKLRNRAEENKLRITEEIATDFNQTLENLNCSFRLKFESGVCGNSECEIVPANDMFIQGLIINLTEEFYKIIEEFLVREA